MNHVHATLRECWVLASNRRCSSEYQDWTTEPTLHAIVVEGISVDEKHRRKGYCKDFLSCLISDPRFELVIVEAVQNPILAEALLRWGWDCDPSVSDYYHKGAGAK